jgi:recombination protein RecT
MSNEVATKPRHVQVVEFFDTQTAEFAKLMPVDAVERFMRAVKNVLIKDPKVAEASKQSIFLECQKAAMDGLVLDGREAALTRFNVKKRWKDGNEWREEWVTEVVYIPMIRGLRKLVSMSPQVRSWDTGLVYEKEYDGTNSKGEPRFIYHAGDTPRLHHEPIIVGERGQVVAAYSVVRLHDGSQSIEVMTRGQLDVIKGRTKSKKADGTVTGPWASDGEEMMRKTVARRHFKQLPLVGKAAEAAERVDALYEYKPGEAGDDFSMAEETPQPKAVTNKKVKAADKLKAKVKAQEEDAPADADDSKTIDHDPDEGEAGSDDDNFRPDEEDF